MMYKVASVLTICISLFTACSSNDDSSSRRNLTFSNNTSFPIQDATSNGPVWDPVITPGVTMSSITVDRTGTIVTPWKVSVHLDLNARYASQHTIELFAPNGASVELTRRPACGFESGNIVTFNSGAVTTIPHNSFPVETGIYLPTSGIGALPPNSLATFFEGKDIDGQWTLKITDNTEEDDDDSDEKINGWKLEFETSAFE